MVEVWHDFEGARNPARFRCLTHERLLAEFVTHLYGRDPFSCPAEPVVLEERRIDYQAVVDWARIRRWIRSSSRVTGDCTNLAPPLFLVWDDAKRQPVSQRELLAAHRDLKDAVGLWAVMLKDAHTPLLE